MALAFSHRIAEALEYAYHQNIVEGIASQEIQR